jgi:hypothetical protein
MKLRITNYELRIAALALVLALLATACGDSRGEMGTPAAAANMQITVTTDPDPPKPGPVTITVEVKDSSGSPIDDATVLLYGGMPSMGHGGIEGELEALGSGKYKGDGTFSMAGRWRLDVDVTREGLPTEKQSFNLEVVR